MAEEAKQTCYEGNSVQSFKFYLEHSGEHKAILKCAHDVLPGEFQRYEKKSWKYLFIFVPWLFVKLVKHDQ